MTQARTRLREAVTRNKEQKLTALLHHVNVDVLRALDGRRKKLADDDVVRLAETGENPR